MARAKKNETEVKVLRYIRDNGPTTSMDLYLNMDMTPATARRMVDYYHSNSYIKRVGKSGKAFEYALGDNGEIRLDYLSDQGY